MIKMNMKIFVVLLSIIVFGCTEARDRKVKRIVDKWTNYEIKFPNNTFFTVFGNDTVSNGIPKSDFYILSYVDSMGCLSCKLRLDAWKQFIADIRGNGEKSVTMLLFMHPKKISDICILLKKEKFDYPVCIDIQDSINILNKFPTETPYQTFLLNKDKKVIAIGNPIHNHFVKELYETIVSGKKDKLIAEDRIQTEIVLDKKSVNFGTFKWQDEKQTDFVIQNIGSELLVIDNIDTSCGCISVDYSKEPVKAKNEMYLKVKYKADHPEYFNKTITIFCNTQNSPIQLLISGNAK